MSAAGSLINLKLIGDFAFNLVGREDGEVPHHVDLRSSSSPSLATTLVKGFQRTRLHPHAPALRPRAASSPCSPSRTTGGRFPTTSSES